MPAFHFLVSLAETPCRLKTNHIFSPQAYTTKIISASHIQNVHADTSLNARLRTHMTVDSTCTVIYSVNDNTEAIFYHASTTGQFFHHQLGLTHDLGRVSSTEYDHGVEDQTFMCSGKGWVRDHGSLTSMDTGWIASEFVLYFRKYIHVPFCLRRPSNVVLEAVEVKLLKIKSFGILRPVYLLSFKMLAILRVDIAQGLG